MVRYHFELIFEFLLHFTSKPTDLANIFSFEYKSEKPTEMMTLLLVINSFLDKGMLKICPYE